MNKDAETLLITTNESEPSSILASESLPCTGFYKLKGFTNDLDYNYCKIKYWKCPNHQCIMQLV